MNNLPNSAAPTTAARVRVIPRLDIKGPNLVKGIHLEGLRVVGKPRDFAAKYYLAGADELVYIDIVASLYGRSNLTDIVREAASEIFIPLTVGGGVRTTEDVKTLLRAGADKVAINTAAVKRPEFLTEAARAFGSQCVVLSIEAKRQTDGRWEAFTDNGRERSGVDVVEWARRGVELGAGEILLTSIDREGTKKGFDLELLAQVSGAVGVPVIACGGAGSLPDFTAAARGGADAVCAAHVFHYGLHSIDAVKDELGRAGVGVRR